MLKQTRFPAKRRAEARAFSTLVDRLVAVSRPSAEQQGLDLQAHLEKAAARRAEEQRQLAERTQRCVLPLFVEDAHGRPDRIGSCVLVRLHSDHYAFTAAHVLRQAGTSRLGAPAGGTLLPLPWSAAWTSSNGDTRDIGVLALPASTLGVFEQCVFLSGREIDENDLPDDDAITSFYFVLGYPASRRQTKISHPAHQVRLKSFHCNTSPVDAAEYVHENLAQADHILLDFDHKDIAIRGARVTPPRLQGVSGGGVFHITRNTMQGPLVAIATENPQNSRLVVDTRLKHFLAAARGLKATVSREVFR
jgi:hypothetical protein